MGFDLGLAAIAYQGVKAEQRRLREDAFTQAQHDYTLANMAEQTGRRGYRDSAAALADAKVMAEQSMLPQETDVARQRLDAQGRLIPLQTDATVGALGAQLSNQKQVERLRPVHEATGLLDAQTGLVKAKTAKEDAINVSEWSEEKKRRNAAEIDASILNRADVQAKKQDDVYATIYHAGTSGKMTEHAIIERINAVAYSSLFPKLKGHTIADIERVQGKDGDMLEMRDAAGAVIDSIPIATMKAAYDAKTGKGKIIELSDGQNAYREAPDGSLTKLTDNKKAVNTLIGRAGGAGAVLDRFAADLVDKAKGEGKVLHIADAKIQASAMLKADPEAWAHRALMSDFNYTAEKDPEKKREMRVEALEAAKHLAGQVGAPGLGTVSPKTQAIIDGSLSGLK